MPVLSNWTEAFYELERFLEQLPEGKKVVFLDELPWMDAPRSRFLSELEAFWNGWASARKDIVLVVCGSATGWMVKKILKNKGDFTTDCHIAFSFNHSHLVYVKNWRHLKG